MYTACLFCHTDLGRNEALEAFPVGRRLAYDQEKGRLWVVCRRCERWNLTPQEERWEAMEQAERLFRATRLRASTGNVGLARLRDGTELVRIGRPLRPEFAAWRYGDQFGRRRRRALVVGGAVVVAVGATMVAPWMGIAGTGVFTQLPNLINALNSGRRLRRRINVPELARGGGTPGGDVRVSVVGAERARLEPDGTDGFALVIPVFPGARFDSSNLNRWKQDAVEVRLRGDAALRGAARLLPHVNRSGGSSADVARAVAWLDEAGAPGALFAQIAHHRHRHQARWGRGGGWAHGSGGVAGLAADARLALEMAAHEEQERRAIEGELRELEAAWRHAEEIAAIADDLLLPERLTQKLGQLRAGASGRSSARAGEASSPSTDSGAASSS